MNPRINYTRRVVGAADRPLELFRNHCVGLWVLLSLALSLTWADAQTFDVQLWNGGVKKGDWTPTLISMGDGGGYTIADTSYNPIGTDIRLYNVTLSYDPFISASVDVVNNTLATQSYTLLFTLPISPAITGGSRMGGSTQGGLTDANFDGIGTLSTAGPGTALYKGQIDGIDVLPLFPDVTTINVPFAGGSASQSTSAGLPGPTIPGPNAFTSIGIKHQFTLTPGDRATFTSFFVVQAVPEPASLSLLGLGGVILILRRRR